jgi:coenzyme PQQ precursor peptide PqqA
VQSFATISFRGISKCVWSLAYFHGENCIPRGDLGYFERRIHGPNGPLGEFFMEWTAPAFEEVCLNCEINSYASAKL